MRIIILGCGPSTGIPLITGEWGKCDPKNPRNRRRRASILIQKNGKNILVDAGPDVREQLLEARITHLDAVIITHAHADHLRGLDDLKGFAYSQKKCIPVYANKDTVASIEIGYPYAIFKKNELYSPFLELHELSEPEIHIEGIDFLTFSQNHGSILSCGIRVEDFAYSTDFNHIGEDSLAYLQGLKCWVVDCLRFAPHPSHSWFSNTLELIRKVQPEEAILTHMNQEIDYEEVTKILCPGIRPAYDGMVVDFSSGKVDIYDK